MRTTNILRIGGSKRGFVVRVVVVDTDVVVVVVAVVPARTHNTWYNAGNVATEADPGFLSPAGR